MTDTNEISKETLTMYEILWGEEYNPGYEDNGSSNSEENDEDESHP